MRTAGTRTTRIAQSNPTGLGPIAFDYGTSSDLDGSNFEDPKDISDIAGLEGDIGGSRGTPPRRPPMGGIDLGKGLDLEKPKPPRSGIGIEIAKSPQGNLGIGVEVPIGLSPFGARGGIAIDPATGQIRGGYGGLGIGKGAIGASIDVGVDTPEGSEKTGCFRYVTVTLGPFSHTYGDNQCEPKAPPTPTPTPTPTGLPPQFPSDLVPKNPSFPNFAVGCLVWQKTVISYKSGTGSREGTQIEVPIPDGIDWQNYDEQVSSDNSFRYDEPTYYDAQAPGYFVRIYLGARAGETGFSDRAGRKLEETQALWDGLRTMTVDSAAYTYSPNRFGTRIYIANKREFWKEPGGGWKLAIETNYSIDSTCKPPPQKVIYIPLPNPPPRKKMNDDCCKQIALLLLMQHKHLGVTPIAGMESLYAITGINPKGEDFQGKKMAFPFEVPEVWLNPTAKREKKILIRNVSELLFIIGAQNERLENFIGTREFLKDSELQLKGSEGGILNWLKNKVTGEAGNAFKYPDPNDYWLNTDDGIINEKEVEVRSLADATRYLVESQNRLERILPIAELKDSSIPARWVYPGKKGQLRVGNLIHLVEYMFRADDRARGYLPIKIKVKDANPAVKGDQPIYLEFQSQADLLREMFKFIIDVEGDGDQSNNFLLRLAMQSCQNHQLNVQNNAMLDAIVEYLDFKVERKTTKVPMPFSPFAGKEPNLLDKLLGKLGFKYQPIPGKIDKNTEKEIESLFEGILQNTEVKVPIVEIPFGEKSLSEALLEILKHASAASAAVSERVGEGALKRIIESAGIAQAVSRFLLKKDIAESNGVGDLDQWINSAELGYTDKPESQSLRFPESDALEPYDRPANENPLIREIDTKDPKAD